jgi:hypothetical protein
MPKSGYKMRSFALKHVEGGKWRGTHKNPRYTEVKRSTAKLSTLACCGPAEERLDVSWKKAGPSNQFATGQGAVGGPALDRADGRPEQGCYIGVCVRWLQGEALDMQKGFEQRVSWRFRMIHGIFSWRSRWCAMPDERLVVNTREKETTANIVKKNL